MNRPTSRRLKRIPIGYDMLAQLLRAGSGFRVKLGLPADAEIVSIFARDPNKELYAIVYSDSYPYLKRSESIPETNRPVIEPWR
jgi:hypothetical protein